ncbi:hypothetical protein EGM51_04055 [Verrucomicrobia bacterium S94]|nr:hypothetical protein EGM51_04055 [Verrucomicrobia bacterium S94]
MAGILHGVTFDDLPEYRFIRAVDFAKEVKQSGVYGNAFNFTGFYEDGEFFHDCGLIIDDIDKMKVDADIVTELFSLIDHAAQNDRPLIFTTQVVGSELVKILTGNGKNQQRNDRVESIINRIRDKAEIIMFDKQAQLL